MPVNNRHHMPPATGTTCRGILKENHQRALARSPRARARKILEEGRSVDKIGTVVSKKTTSAHYANGATPRTRSEARVLARMRPDRVMALAERFSNSFRNDPELTPERAAVQAEGITRIFASYPEEVVLEVMDLVAGLPSKQPFFPHLHEVKAACEAAAAPLHRTAARDIAALETAALLA